MNDACSLGEASDLTYFAFATPQDAPSADVRRPLGELPEVLGGRYRIERLLGVGGMGAVYRARDLLREQFGDPAPHVALKTLSADFAEYPDAHTLLYSEFALSVRLAHRHVVRLFGFEVDCESQRAFLLMELLEGPTLDQLLDTHPQGLPWGECRAIALPLLEALAHSHERGVLHGDLKPGNVILAEDGLRLFDYGLGQSLGEPAGLPRLCRSRIAAWTPRYAAPELLEGAPLSVATDIYAMGCLLYELCGGHPFSRLDAGQAKRRGLDGTLQCPTNLPRRCWPALRTALAFDPRRRRIDAAGLLTAFRETRPGRLARWLRFSR